MYFYVCIPKGYDYNLLSLSSVFLMYLCFEMTTGTGYLWWASSLRKTDSFSISNCWSSVASSRSWPSWNFSHPPWHVDWSCHCYGNVLLWQPCCWYFMGTASLLHSEDIVSHLLTGLIDWKYTFLDRKGYIMGFHLISGLFSLSSSFGSLQVFYCMFGFSWQKGKSDSQ